MKINYLLIPLVTLLVSIVGSQITSKGMDWYKTIILPSWTPVGSIIGLVWTTIFILSTIAALYVWNKFSVSRRFKWIFIIFSLNAILNVLWSYLFFGKHLILAAFVEAIVLGLSVLILIFLIWPIKKWPALLLVPYALWVAFASYLTYSVWTLNK